MTNSTFCAVLFDIEGTTTSIAFVKEVLFPFVFKNVGNFLKNALATKSHIDVIDELIQLSIEQSKLFPNEIETIVKSSDEKAWIGLLEKNVQTWILQDQKFTSLKKLQGIMWMEAYVNSEIKGHIYPDVPKAFERLCSSGFQLFIFSSGSIQAQKLLFQYSDFGDLTNYLTNYFDTTIGSKVEAQSYAKIAAEIGCQPNKILFVTDMEREAFAASAAGMQAVLSVREGNMPLSDKALSMFRQIYNFDKI